MIISFYILLRKKANFAGSYYFKIQVKKVIENMSLFEQMLTLIVYRDSCDKQKN